MVLNTMVSNSYLQAEPSTCADQVKLRDLRVQAPHI